MGESGYVRTRDKALRAVQAAGTDPAFDPATEPIVRPFAMAGMAVAPIQTKLAVGSVDDPAEAQADRIARDVVAVLQRRGRPVEDEPTPTAPFIARLTHGHDHGDGPGAEGGPATPIVQRLLARAGTTGQPLSAPVRRDFEAAMGADLGGVRVHTGDAARAGNESINAKAFTSGRDIFFRDGLPDTSTEDGQSLLAHELTHTVQQAGADAPIHRFYALVDRPAPGKKYDKVKGRPYEWIKGDRDPKHWRESSLKTGWWARHLYERIASATGGESETSSSESDEDEFFSMEDSDSDEFFSMDESEELGPDDRASVGVIIGAAKELAADAPALTAPVEAVVTGAQAILAGSEPAPGVAIADLETVVTTLKAEAKSEPSAPSDAETETLGTESEESESTTKARTRKVKTRKPRPVKKESGKDRRAREKLEELLAETSAPTAEVEGAAEESEETASEPTASEPTASEPTAPEPIAIPETVPEPVPGPKLDVESDEDEGSEPETPAPTPAPLPVAVAPVAVAPAVVAAPTTPEEGARWAWNGHSNGDFPHAMASSSIKLARFKFVRVLEGLVPDQPALTRFRAEWDVLKGPAGPAGAVAAAPLSMTDQVLADMKRKFDSWKKAGCPDRRFRGAWWGPHTRGSTAGATRIPQEAIDGGLRGLAEARGWEYGPSDSGGMSLKKKATNPAGKEIAFIYHYLGP